ncbi:ribosomal RNA-processing protein 12 [Dendrothele bispora CBS 962.96]|uniref:Ribosomal RNA-processing protein 12 n=1 Tax=Dendrothele bispora (strain CBS 962.96) TaxID=1314807 RepID=A0A4S8M1D0_DENBC|nr:ribosomal RNA-processing protein 12 [Dendrothele bispora CBS 962.96]
MDQALAKIRVQISSSLPHQKAPASLLVALESTFKEQKTEPSPTAYFAALLTTLDATIHKKEVSLNEGDILPAELYLIALVIPFVSVSVIRANLSTLLNLTAPLFPSLFEHAPALRSQLSLYNRSQLETHGIRQAFASILQLCLDPRPKVRKKAAEVVKNVLSKPPLPLVRHPYAERTAEWTQSALKDVNQGALAQSKSKKPEGSSDESAIHLLAFIRPILPDLPSSSYPPITALILSLPRLGNPYLSQSSYSVLSDLFSRSRDDTSGVDVSVLPDILKTVMALPPSKVDATLAPAWVIVLGDAMAAFSVTDNDACMEHVQSIWKTVWPFLESSNTAVRQAAARSVDLLLDCVSQNDHSFTKFGDFASHISKGLSSVNFTRAIPELLQVASSLVISSQNSKDKKPLTHSVNQTILSLIEQIGSLRVAKGFEYKEAADGTLSSAMRAFGPEVILKVLPLNIEPSDRQASREPRAFLLPLLAQPHPSPLSHFVSYFVPLSERMFDLQQKADQEGRESEAKLWSVLVAQIWTGFFAYCHGTTDLETALNPSFSQLLSQLLYSQPDLRLAVLKGLKIIVDSNVSIAAQNEAINPARIDTDKAARNVDFLRTQAESWLAVFFNVFGSVGRDSRGIVGEVIVSWAGITPDAEINKAYGKVVSLLKNDLAKTSQMKSGVSSDESVTVTALDLLLLLLPYLSTTDLNALFQTCLSSTLLAIKDNAVQKRGYKVLARIVESKKTTVDVETVFRELDTLSDSLVPAAKKDRFGLLSALIPLIPSSAMHLIPSLIPEAVLGTKETSDKTRTAAFELIIAMGHKMSEGGVVKRDMLDGMDEDSPTEAAANIEEFMKMVAGGLAGSSPHMISASVTALSRLVFEFKDQISNDMKNEIFTTLLVFLSSANREIVKSVLGFIKLSIHTFPINIVQPHLKELVPALLNWSHDHKNHFKAKVRHIFERLLRRFSWEEVYSCASNEDASKVLINIKKRKDRAKRRKENRREDEDEEEPQVDRTTGDAFEDIVYGSESELEDTDEDEPTHRSETRPGRKGMRLRMDDDEPMDLLQGVASRVTNKSSDRRRKPGQDAAQFKVDEESGKMVINDSDDDEEAGNDGQDVSGTAYRENITSVDGFTRGPNGRIKFNKDTKKRRRNEEGDDAMDVDDDGDGKSSGKQKRRSSVKLGQEFKSKRAGGDLKKSGVDPYAYLTLAQASKKGRGGKSRIGIAGKR